MKELYLPKISISNFDNTMDELYEINEYGEKILSKEKLENLYILCYDKNPLVIGHLISFAETIKDKKELGGFHTGSLITLALLNNQLKENFNLIKNN